MADVRSVSIETVARGTTIVHQLSATVNVGGSLVDLRCDSEQNPELAALVDGLCARLVAIAVERVQASLHAHPG